MTDEDHYKLTQEIKDLAKKSIEEFCNNKLNWKKRIKSGFTGFSIHALFAAFWIIRNYRWIKEFLRIKLGISIKWVIIILFSAWVIGGSLQNASHY